MHSPHKHVIVGGGFAGLALARQLNGDKRFDVTVIDPKSNFEYHGALYRSANGVSPLEVVIPYRDILHESTITLSQDFVTNVRPQSNELKLMSGRVISYDTVTFAMGYEAEYYNILGMREFSLTLYTAADAIILRSKLFKSFTSNHKKLAITVVGAGPTGIELITSLQTFADLIAKKHGTVTPELHLTIIDAAPKILPTLEENVGTQALLALGKQNISVLLNTSIESASKKLTHLSNHVSLPYDILIWTAGNKANSFFEHHPQLFELGPRGRVIVSEQLQPLSPDMYVVGDSAMTQYSGTAHAAVETGIFVANDLRIRVSNQDRPKYESSKPDYAVPIGQHNALATQDNVLFDNDKGWDLRRQADLRVLKQLMPESLAYEHWLKGESLASFLQ